MTHWQLGGRKKKQSRQNKITWLHLLKFMKSFIYNDHSCANSHHGMYRGLCNFCFLCIQFPLWECELSALGCIQEAWKNTDLQNKAQLAKTYGFIDYQSWAWLPLVTITQDTFNIQQNLYCLLLISLWKCQYFLSVFQIMGKNETRKMWTVSAFSIHCFLQCSSAYDRNLRVSFCIIINKLSLNQGSAVWV